MTNEIVKTAQSRAERLSNISKIENIIITPKTIKASELKIGDKFKKQGFLFEVASIKQDSYKNGNQCVLVDCKIDGYDIIDSFFCFKLETKIKLSK